MINRLFILCVSIGIVIGMVIPAYGFPGAAFEYFGITKNQLGSKNYHRDTVHTDDVFICNRKNHAENYVILRSTLKFESKYPEFYEKEINKFVNQNWCLFDNINYTVIHVEGVYKVPSIKENGLWGRLVEFYILKVLINDTKINDTKTIVYIAIEDPNKIGIIQ